MAGTSLRTSTFVDVTELLRWAGHPTGIQRVVRELGAGLLAADPGVKAVVFAQGRFQILDQPLNAIAPRGRMARQRTGVSDTLTRRLRERYRRLPEPRQLRLFGVANVVQKALAKVSASARLTHTTAGHYGPTLTSSAGDSLVTLGPLSSNFSHLAAVLRLANDGVQLCCVVCDIIPVQQPHLFTAGFRTNFKQGIRQILETAAVVFPISERTRVDLTDFIAEHSITPIPALRVIRLGDRLDIGPHASSAPANLDVSRRFALSVGTVEVRKNHALIYTALKLAVSEGVADRLPHIYIVGRDGWLAADLRRLLSEDNDVRDRITLLADVSDCELDWMYRHAQFSIYPSTCEGWGLPVTESLAAGTPCITSRGTSMEEIAPEFTRLISPFDARALLDALLDYTDPAVLDGDAARIRRCYTPAVWDDTAQTILAAI